VTIGVRFRNGPNSIQVGSDYPNHALLATGTYSLNAGADSTINIVATAPILAVTGTWPISVIQTTRSGNNWSFDIFCQSQPAAGKWYIFDVVQAASLKFPFGFGMIVRDPVTGATTYRSDLKYLRVQSVRSFVPMPTPIKFSGAQSETLPQAGLAAVIANSGARVLARDISVTLPDGTRGDAIERTVYQLAAAVDGTTLRYGSNDTRTTTQNEGNDQLDEPPVLMLIDISNFDV
jgi:hypothetical protein